MILVGGGDGNGDGDMWLGGLVARCVDDVDDRRLKMCGGGRYR